MQSQSQSRIYIAPLGIRGAPNPVAYYESIHGNWHKGCLSQSEREREFA